MLHPSEKSPKEFAVSIPVVQHRLELGRSLFSRFRINSLSYGYVQLLTLAVQLLLVPFFLRYWGTQRYSEWLVLTGIPSMLALLDFGVAQASASRAIMLAATNDKKGATKSLQTAFAFTLLTCLVVLAISSGAALCVNWRAVLMLTSLSPSQASTVILLMTGYLCTNLFGALIGCWFRTIDRTALGAFLIANRRAVDIAISLAVLIGGGGAVQLAAGMFAAQLVTLLLLVTLAIKLSPWHVFGLQYAAWSEFKSIWRPAFAFAGFPLAQMITLQGSLQVLNQIATPSVVVGFTMARTLMRLINQIGVTCNNALTPEIARLAGLNQMDKAREFTTRATFWVVFLCVVAYVGGVAVGPLIINEWSHRLVHVARVDLALIGIHAILNVTWFIRAAMLMSTNRHSRISVIYVASSALAIALWIAFSKLVDPIMGASILLALPELAVLLCFRTRA